jgi:hypothetical protein
MQRDPAPADAAGLPKLLALEEAHRRVVDAIDTTAEVIDLLDVLESAASNGGSVDGCAYLAVVIKRKAEEARAGLSSAHALLGGRA